MTFCILLKVYFLWWYGRNEREFTEYGISRLVIRMSLDKKVKSIEKKNFRKDIKLMSVQMWQKEKKWIEDGHEHELNTIVIKI